MNARRLLLYGGASSGLLLLLAFVVFMAVKPPLLDGVSFSRVVYDRRGDLLKLTLTSDEKYRLFTPLAAISPRVRDAVLLHEDQYFYAHPGINPVAVVRAMAQTYLGSGRRLGASTLTMQLARLKYGIHSRTAGGKFQQMLYALRYELHYTKDALLEAYLNLAPYGYNIEGIGAATAVYFHTQPAQLTLPQAITLAVLPQSPSRRRMEPGVPTKPALLAARNRLFDRWLEERPEDVVQNIFFKLPLTNYGRRDLPQIAPHLTRDLLSRQPEQQKIVATLDAERQRLVDTLLRRYVADQHDAGIRNASALLLNWRSMQVLASVGSADFYNAVIDGQVDGTRARRSPGSTLKPFIYALAFDQGLIHPQSILSDTPTGFGSFSPDNFERDFRGPISAADALRFSRNIPAIKLAAQLRKPTLYQFFTQANLTKLRPEREYGLSLVLGGADVTLRELTALYAMLANDGVLQPLHFTMGASETIAKRLLSPEASAMTLEILSHTPHPWRSEDEGTLAWKTGTSNGFHDAWTAGVFGDYVLVVWVGNFNGAASPALVGVRSAAPLFFRLAGALRPTSGFTQQVARLRQTQARQIAVCAATGAPSDAPCPGGLVSSWYIPGVSPLRGMDVMRPLLVNLQTGRRACRMQPGVTGYRNYALWPSAVRQTLHQAGLVTPEIPKFEPGCDVDALATDDAQQLHPPTITTPQPHVIYQARPAGTEGEAILLRASADSLSRRLYWFVDSRYLGQTAPEASLAWQPEPGNYTVRVTDEFGHSASVKTKVSYAP